MQRSATLSNETIPNFSPEKPVTWSDTTLPAGGPAARFLDLPIPRLGTPRLNVSYMPPLDDKYRITEQHIIAAARTRSGR